MVTISNKFIIFDLQTVAQHVEQLAADTPALWGKMNAQQMLEHLELVLDISLGTIKIDHEPTVEKLEKSQAFLKGDYEMPRNFKAKFISENPQPCKHHDIIAAKEVLLAKIDRYFEYYKDKDVQHLHPVFGWLPFDGWNRVHQKHFSHHFNQFGIIG